MEWQFHSDAPIYTQLVAQIKLRIVTGEYLPGQRLPAVRDLALEAGVNPNTMQRALQELERERLVFSQRTSGRFVTEDVTMIEEAKNSLAQAQLQVFLREMKALGYTMEQIRKLLEDTEKGAVSNGDSGMQ
jgi:DNA-binding transcriptional regulator YhcF (GntR family)